MRSNKQFVFLFLLLAIFMSFLLACTSQIQVANTKTIQSATNFNTSFNINRSSNPIKLDEADFRRNRKLWSEQNIKNYNMTIEARLFANIANEALIEVQNSRTKSIKRTPASGTGSVDLYKDYDTVEKIFGIIEQAQKSKAEGINVSYDKTLGYPWQTIIDGRLDAYDDQISIIIKKLEVRR